MSRIEPSQARIVRLTAPVFRPGEHERRIFAQAGLRVEIVDAEEPGELAERVRDADIVAVVGTKIPRQVVDAMDQCRAIIRMGTGTDKIDVARATERGIPVVNTPYFCVEEMADHSMAMILSLARKLPGVHRAFQEGHLGRARRMTATNVRVSHCTLGLVGFGRSAVHTARRARGFGMRVLATRQNKTAPTTEADALGVVMTDLDTVLRESDYVSLHLPLTPASYHMINREAIAKMKPTACLINTSRGALVDEPALFEAIKEGRLGGAGLDTHELLDVFSEDVGPDCHPLFGLDNVILTPHIAAGSVQAHLEMMGVGLQNTLDILNGRWPLQENIVNPTVAPRFPLAR